MFRKTRKNGVRLRIPGFGHRHIHTLLSVGTIIKDQLVRLADLVEIHILTADKRTKSSDCFGALPVHVHILAGDDQDVQKRRYLDDFAPANVAAFGNGNNDRLLFDEVKGNGGLCIAVDNGEGCAIDAILHAHLFVHDASKALGLLLDPEVCAAALRY